MNNYSYYEKSPKILKFLLYTLITLLVFACNENTNNSSKATIDEFNFTAQSNNKYFIINVKTENGGKPPIGKYHNWIVTLKDNNSRPIENALFSIGGGMPSHGHELPTQPEISKSLNKGKYLLEGVKFNMDGNWIIIIAIYTENLQDYVELNFDVTY